MLEMATPRRDKLKLSLKLREASNAEGPQRQVEGLPYASILKGYYGSASASVLSGTRSNLRSRDLPDERVTNEMFQQRVSDIV